MKILSFDPGKSHFAFAVLDNGRCLSHGFIEHTITSMSYDAIEDELTRFRRAVDDVIAAAKLKSGRDRAFVERFQHRPRFGGGAVGEYINVMIGILLEKLAEAGLKPQPIPSNTWKTHWAKQYGKTNKGEDLMVMVGQKISGIKTGSKKKGKRTKTIWVDGLLDQQPRAEGLTSHEGDAIGLGCFGWYKLTGFNVLERTLT